MRGKEPRQLSAYLFPGITPACAGKSDSHRFHQAQAEDHPRMCGEKVDQRRGSVKIAGSPPHVRGKAIGALINVLCVGITPACAGKSAIAGALPAIGRDHPRMCGEKLAAVPSYTSTLGSPPHVRGKVGYSDMSTGALGITPACAGKSSSRNGYSRIRGDHPRMCGEKVVQLPGLIVGAGSPPHVRGKECIHLLFQVTTGITPACAGKS